MPKSKLTRELMIRLNRAVEKHHNLVVISVYNILFINDIMDGLIIDLSSELKRQNLYRQKLKQIFSPVLKERHIYERLVNTTLGERTEYLADANELYTDCVGQHITTLTYTIKTIIDKQQTPHSMLVAMTETARIIGDLACRRVDYWMNQLARAEPDLAQISSVDYLRITTLCEKFNRFHQEICNPSLRSILQSDAQYTLAVNILTQKLTDDKLTEKSALQHRRQESA